MKYITIAVLSLQAGMLLGLTEAQAASRKTVLAPAPARKGWYTTTGPVQFKVGEEILCDSEIPKHLADAVESPDVSQAKAKARAKAKADAKAKAEADAAALTADEARAADAAQALELAQAQALEPDQAASQG
jgi:colicin import membrane protein